MQKRFSYIFLLLLYLIVNKAGFSQNKTIKIQLHLEKNNSLPKKLHYKQSFISVEKASSSLKNFKQKLFSKGFIEASIDSFVLKDNILHTYIYLGKQYLISKLKNGNLSEETLQRIHFKESDYDTEIFNFGEIEDFQQKILSSYINNGFPFAEVYLDSFNISGNDITTKIFAEKHLLFTFDSLVVNGETKTTSHFLQHYLNIHKDDLYDQSQIDAISKKIAQLSFVKEYRDVQVVFVADKAIVNVFLAKEKSNEFNLLLGILPNDKLRDRKVTITGDGRLHLNNSFGVGEEIYADFKQLKPQTQNLDIAFNYPYFMNLPFGLSGAFNLYKNDTSYLNLNTKAGVSYPFNGADYVQVFYENQISNVLNTDTTGIKSSQKLPKLLDKTNNLFGLKLHFQNLDYIFQPRKGFDFTISAAIGTRIIKKNNELTNIESTIYKDIKLTDINYNLAFDFDYYIPIHKRHSFLVANSSKFFISKNVLQNEKMRIGGAKILRGFDEEEIISPFFSVFTVEYHFSLSKNAYFYTFGDMAVVEDFRFGSESVDIPFGFGVGTTFETKGGIFSLSYALGKQFENKIELKNGKIHFGYINLF